jgi:hypothetical protein
VIYDYQNELMSLLNKLMIIDNVKCDLWLSKWIDECMVDV